MEMKIVILIHLLGIGQKQESLKVQSDPMHQMDYFGWSWIKIKKDDIQRLKKPMLTAIITVGLDLKTK